MRFRSAVAIMNKATSMLTSTARSGNIVRSEAYHFVLERRLLLTDHVFFLFTPRIFSFIFLLRQEVGKRKQWSVLGGDGVDIRRVAFVTADGECVGRFLLLLSSKAKNTTRFLCRIRRQGDENSSKFISSLGDVALVFEGAVVLALLQTAMYPVVEAPRTGGGDC